LFLFRSRKFLIWISCKTVTLHFTHKLELTFFVFLYFCSRECHLRLKSTE
jgi:hypothetical protein